MRTGSEVSQIQPTGRARAWKRHVLWLLSLSAMLALAPTVAFGQSTDSADDGTELPPGAGFVYTLGGIWTMSAGCVTWRVQDDGTIYDVTAQAACDSAQVEFVQDGDQVAVHLLEPSAGCGDPLLQATLSGASLTGTATTCTRQGPSTVAAQFTVNLNGTSITGSWGSGVGVDLPESFTYQPCGATRTAAAYGLADNGISSPWHERRLYTKASGSTVWHWVRTLGADEAYVPGPNEKVAPHDGIDYRSWNDAGLPAPEPFVAPFDGTVTVAGGKYNTIVLKLDDGNQLQFLHASRVDVKDGPVKAGTQLGLTGNTAPYPIGIHLHVQARDARGHPINPDCTGWHIAS
jgi:hypothetical protein